jgi:hypothetical protein
MVKRVEEVIGLKQRIGPPRFAKHEMRYVWENGLVNSRIVEIFANFSNLAAMLTVLFVE